MWKTKSQNSPLLSYFLIQKYQIQNTEKEIKAELIVRFSRFQDKKKWDEEGRYFVNQKAEIYYQLLFIIIQWINDDIISAVCIEEDKWMRGNSKWREEKKCFNYKRTHEYYIYIVLLHQIHEINWRILKKNRIFYTCTYKQRSC